MSLGLFTVFRNPILCGVICFLVDDMLGTGDEKFELKMNELDQLAGFGWMKGQKFSRRGDSARNMAMTRSRSQ